jgi:hypothetical protein
VTASTTQEALAVDAALNDILGSWRAGYALPGDVYRGPQIYV